MDATLYAIALTFIKGIGPINAKGLIGHFESVQGIFDAKPADFKGFNKNISVLLDKNIKNQAIERAAKEIEFARKHNINIHCLLDESYPYRLRECEDSPIILYSLGDCDLNSGYFVAVIGTRNVTSYGKECCYKLIKELSANQQDATIISGLAYGVDSIAHKAALNENFHTIGVVAHGLDRLYPAQNKALARKIVDSGGAIVTEYPSETRIDAANFVKRNRIIAGLCDASVIVESAERGGALITAEAANTYNRDVFAFPGRCDDNFSQGCNNLIKTNQAQIITSADDIINAMGWKKKTPEQQPLFTELTDEERKIVEILHKTELDANDLSKELKIPIQKMLSTLVVMELKGLVKSSRGNFSKA
ncbi:MAG: DNA-processing protein DprA [Prevotellaceae bacterium]|jgi:DNA processing protein|nr:DNA-processing protein DprA [Prevotellaceae bacterium]